MSSKKKINTQGKKIAETLINDMGSIKALEYAENMLEDVDLDEMHIDYGFPIYQMWEAARKYIIKWMEGG